MFKVILISLDARISKYALNQKGCPYGKTYWNLGLYIGITCMGYFWFLEWHYIGYIFFSHVSNQSRFDLQMSRLGLISSVVYPLGLNLSQIYGMWPRRFPWPLALLFLLQCVLMATWDARIMTNAYPMQKYASVSELALTTLKLSTAVSEPAQIELNKWKCILQILTMIRSY